MNLQGIAFSFPWEVSLMEWLQGNLSQPVIQALSYFSMFGEELLMVLVIVFLYLGWNKQMGKTVAFSVLMAGAVGSMIKNVATRRRPYFDHEGIKILRVVEKKADIYDIAAQGYSFPSLHSSGAVSLYGSIAVTGKKKGLTALAVILPLLTGISRVVVGAHYPTDVLAGWALGGCAALLIPWLQKKIKKTEALYAILLAAAIPGLFFCKSIDYFTYTGMLIGFMGGTLLDEKRAVFESTRKPLWIALRVAGGLGCYFALNTLLKLPFPADFLSGGSQAALLVRFARYAVVTFVVVGLYPMLFKIVEKGRS